MSSAPKRDYHIVILGAGALQPLQMRLDDNGSIIHAIRIPVTGENPLTISFNPPGGVGKSCLTAQFVQNVWIESYDPTIEDSYRKHIVVDGRQCMLEILDTAGTEQFTAMRELYMKSGQGFLLVFSIDSPSSLLELRELREQIIRIKDDEHVPIVIVGNKSDLDEERKVSRQDAFALSQRWGKAPYYEASARRRANVDEVFIDLCRQIIRKEGTQAYSLDEEEVVYSPASGGAAGGEWSHRGRHRPRKKHHRSRGKKKRSFECAIL